MANTNIYYNRAADYNPDEVADGDSLEAEFDAIQLGFKKVEEAKVSPESPAFTGTPTAPTAAAGTSTTQLATTAFVANALGDKVSIQDLQKLISAMGSDQAAIISTETSLIIPISAKGSFYQFTGSAPASWALPTPIGNAGAKFTIWNNGASTLASTTPAGYFYGSTISGQYASYGIPNGGICVFESDGYNWINIVNTMVSPSGASLISAPALTDGSNKLITSAWLKSIFDCYINKSSSASASSLATSISFTAPSNGMIVVLSEGYISGGSSQTLVGPNLSATNATFSSWLVNFNQAASQFGVASGLLTVAAGAAVTITSTIGNGEAGGANVQLLAIFIPKL